MGDFWRDALPRVTFVMRPMPHTPGRKARWSVHLNNGKASCFRKSSSPPDSSQRSPVTAGSAFSAGDTLLNGKSRFGHPTDDMQGARVVDPTNAKALNVRCGDTLTFVNADKKF